MIKLNLLTILVKHALTNNGFTNTATNRIVSDEEGVLSGSLLTTLSQSATSKKEQAESLENAFNVPAWFFVWIEQYATYFKTEKAKSVIKEAFRLAEQVTSQEAWDIIRSHMSISRIKSIYENTDNTCILAFMNEVMLEHANHAQYIIDNTGINESDKYVSYEFELMAAFPVVEDASATITMNDSMVAHSTFSTTLSSCGSQATSLANAVLSKNDTFEVLTGKAEIGDELEFLQSAIDSVNGAEDEHQDEAANDEYDHLTADFFSVLNEILSGDDVVKVEDREAFKPVFFKGAK